MRAPHRGRRRFAAVLTATLAVTGIGVSAGPAALAAPEDDPAVMGAWSAPFEEGGDETPRCEIVSDPDDAADPSPERLLCKPTAVTVAVLPDGRVLYGNGLESQENAEETVVPSLAPESRDSRTRVLDLLDGTPEFTIPENETSDGVNPNIVEGRDFEDCVTNPETLPGVLGVPGRPGDGFTGSLAGQLGIPPQDPTCAPDDVQDNDGDIFCADIVQMGDGRQLLVGGTDWYNEPTFLEQAEGDPLNVGVVELEGLRSARIFDHLGGKDGKGRWDATTPMKFGRWYPGATTMADGQVAVVSGVTKLVKDTQLSQVRRTETYDPQTAQWTERFSGPASEKTLPLNPRILATPSGKIFYTGDGQMWGPFGYAVDEVLFAQQGFFNFETDEWENTGLTLPRSSPAVVSLPMKAPYDEMTILRAGGTFGPPPGSFLATATTTLTTITADDEVTERPGATMANPRWFVQPTPLPTGEVLLTSGARTDEVIAPGFELPVPTPEIYDPVADEFRTVALPERVRTYHNSAVLLPNGQVLVGGHSPLPLGYGVQRDAGIPPFSANNDKDSSFELFNPPYLYQGDRPHIDDVQAGLAWGSDFDIVTEDAADITNVMLMRMPAAQHVVDNDTRSLELPFTVTGDNTLRATTPPDGLAAPPGNYYLFLNRGEVGSYVPSVARIVQVGAKGDDSRSALEPMGEETVFGFEGNGAAPLELNTLFNNPPNPGETPTVPGQPDPLGTTALDPLAPSQDTTGGGTDLPLPVTGDPAGAVLGGVAGGSQGRRRPRP
jgi:hypothetical protein